MSTGSEDTRPMVSVLMIAFNVEPWIAAAIESVLSQDVDFRYELVIGEDCSTDGTRAIVEDYAARHPGRVRAILRERNLGMNANFFATLDECRGRYIALLDGDDYWTHPAKLQHQVALLEAHPEHAICFHNADVVYDDDTPSHPFHMVVPDRRLSAPMPEQISTLEDIVLGNFMQTGSVVFRAGLTGERPSWFESMPTFDWPLHVANAMHGSIRYIDETWSAYRVHEGGVWSMNMSFYATTQDVDRMLAAHRRLDEWLDNRFSSRIRQHARWLHAEGMALCYEAGRISQGNAYARQYFAGMSLARIVSEWRILTTIARANLKRRARVSA